jgi:hypothetical protein
MKLYMQKPSGSKILMRISWGGHGEVLSLSLSHSPCVTKVPHGGLGNRTFCYSSTMCAGRSTTLWTATTGVQGKESEYLECR